MREGGTRADSGERGRKEKLGQVWAKNISAMMTA